MIIISVVVLMKRLISRDTDGCPCVSTHNAVERLRNKARASEVDSQIQIRTLPDFEWVSVWALIHTAA